MLEAYSVAVDPSRINKFILLVLDVYLIDVEPVGISLDVIIVFDAVHETEFDKDLF